MSKTKRAYKYRFYPIIEKKRVFAQKFGCCRFVCNWGISTRKTASFQRGQKLSYNNLSAMLPHLKKEHPGLSEVSSVPVQQSLRHLDRAYKNFFEGRAKYPTFKKRRNTQSATYASNAFTTGSDGQLTLAKMNEPLAITFHQALPTGCKPSSLTVSKDGADRYFISLLVEEEIKPLPVTSSQVGLDLGLKSMVILSTGEAVGNPRYYAKDEKRLAKAQRRYAKKKKGGNNRENARSSVGWGEFVRQLEYKSEWYGRTLIKIDRWYPSSKTCYDCKHVVEDLPLDVREWTCPACGISHDRDINAARNRSLRGTLGISLWRRCQTHSGESSDRQPPAKQESPDARMGSPCPQRHGVDVTAVSSKV